MKEKRKKRRSGPNKRSDLVMLKLIKRLKKRMKTELEKGLTKPYEHITKWREITEF